jgi:hypothetical protein
MKAAIAPALLALGFVLLGGDDAAAGSSLTICKVAGSHCSMRCRQKPYPVLAKHCRDACKATQAKCIQQAYSDIELGKVPPPGGGATQPRPRQSEEDKKNAEMGKTTSPSGGSATAGSRQSEEERKNIELGKIPPPTAGGTTTPSPRQSEEDKKNAEMGRTTPPAGRPSPGSTPPQPCASWQVRYANGSCGCPSGMRGPKCGEIILH